MERDLRPESWLIGFKLVLLLYVVITSYTESREAWNTIVYLLYICFDLTAYIKRGPAWRVSAESLAALFIAVAAYYVEPAMALLLPIQLYGLASSLKGLRASVHGQGMGQPRGPASERNGSGAPELPRWQLLWFIPALAPLLLLPRDMQAPYALIALLSLLFRRLLDAYVRQSAGAKAAIEELRADNHRLQRKISESNDYIRQSEYTFKLEERNRLSQDIHDKIGHAMTGALIQMEAAKRLQEKDPQRSAELLGNAITISKEGIESIRLVLRDMKPLAEQLGLNRLRLFIDEFAATHSGLRAALTFEGDVGRIEQLHWRIIQQNVTEALTNAAKYARATSVSVHIEVLNTMIKASVTDNGVGAAQIVKGLGISGMEERAASANGKIIVDGSAGFSVTTLLPCSKT